MNTMTIEQQINDIKQSAESMIVSETATIGTASIGDVVRQGDLYLVCLESVPNQHKKISNRQLAPGSTQGSRHVAEGDCTIFEAGFELANVPVELKGPVIKCNGPTEITHPEHGNRILPAETVWGVVYQRQFAEEIRRVQD